MAIILFGLTECSICNATLNECDDIVSNSHFIFDQNDSLWRFSDSGMHKRCFLNWEYRLDFIKKYNDIVGNMTAGDGTYRRMEEDGQISVLVRNG